MFGQARSGGRICLIRPAPATQFISLIAGQDNIGLMLADNDGKLANSYCDDNNAQLEVYNYVYSCLDDILICAMFCL